MPEDNEYIFIHECEFDGCTNRVEFDDEPWCFTHSPDEGSSVRGYSSRRKALHKVLTMDERRYLIKTLMADKEFDVSDPNSRELVLIRNRLLFKLTTEN